MELYDLVKVIKCEDEEFIEAVGIIKEVHYSNLYELLFVGEYLNSKSIKLGRLLFRENELEGI